MPSKNTKNKKESAINNVFAGFGAMLDAPAASTEKEEPADQPQKVDEPAVKEPEAADNKEVMQTAPSASKAAFAERQQGASEKTVIPGMVKPLQPVGDAAPKSVETICSILDATFSGRTENVLVLRMSDIVEQTGLSMMTVSRAMRALEKAGRYKFARAHFGTRVTKLYSDK